MIKSIKSWAKRRDQRARDLERARRFIDGARPEDLRDLAADALAKMQGAE